MNWLIIAIVAHFIFSLVFIIDKYLFSHTQLRPVAYAFYVGAFGGIAILLFPFGFDILPRNQMLVSFVAGVCFVLAIFFFYKSVQLGEVSRITPIIGGLIPLFTFIFAYFVLGEKLLVNQIASFSLLVIGGIIMAWPRKRARFISGLIKTSLIRRLPLAILAALFFAGSYVLSKYIYSYYPFINGFIWIRLGGVIGALILFILPFSRRAIMKTSSKVKLKTGGLALFNKGLSGLAFIMLNYAIFLGSVTLINALQGIQYAFLFVIALFLSRKYPTIIKEQINQGVVTQKIIAIILIITGLSILAF